MRIRSEFPIKTDPASIKESIRLAQNYHKNRLIDAKEAHAYYNERMEQLHGCNAARKAKYGKKNWGSYDE